MEESASAQVLGFMEAWVMGRCWTVDVLRVLTRTVKLSMSVSLSALGPTITCTGPLSTFQLLEAVSQ